MSQRLFLGLPIPSNISSKLTECQEIILQTYPKIRLIPPENFHITVSFFGNVSESDIPVLASILERTIQTHKQIVFNFEEIVLAPPGRKSTMVWAKFDSYEFADFAANIDRAVRDKVALNDFKPPKKQTPHITLARSRFPLSQSLSLTQPEIQPFRVQTCHLYKSTLTAKGSLYTAVSTFNLAS